jgi:8-oxo-dGTP pyrophosphatase MutT (NUDIX family)
MRPGGPAPWSDLPEGRRRGVTVAAVRRGLAARAGVQPSPRHVTLGELPFHGDTRPAAVLCLLFDQDGEASVVLTQRAAHLPSHAGEVSFPGGRMRPGELPLQAALREAEEEVGLRPAAVDVIGELTPLTTRRSPALVHCFVGRFDGPGAGGRALRADRSEVDRIFWVPLARLAEGGVYHEELWPAEPGADVGGAPLFRSVPFFQLDQDVVWGATGRLLTELLGAVLVPGDAGGSAKGTLVES